MREKEVGEREGMSRAYKMMTRGYDLENFYFRNGDG